MDSSDGETWYFWGVPDSIIYPVTEKVGKFGLTRFGIECWWNRWFVRNMVGRIVFGGRIVRERVSELFRKGYLKMFKTSHLGTL